MIQSLFGSSPASSEPNLLERLKAGIQKTRDGLMEKLEDAVSGRKEIDRTVLQRHTGRIDVTVRGEHDHGQVDAALLQHLLQLEAAHTLHLQVCEQTTAPARVVDGEEILRRGKHGGAQAFQRDEKTQRVANRRIVIDQKNRVLSHSQARSGNAGASIGRRSLKHAPPSVELRPKDSSPPPVASAVNGSTTLVQPPGSVNGGILNGKAISLPHPAYPPVARAAPFIPPIYNSPCRSIKTSALKSPRW